jgi:hypothetical protein
LMTRLTISAIPESISILFDKEKKVRV